MKDRYLSAMARRKKTGSDHKSLPVARQPLYFRGRGGRVGNKGGKGNESGFTLLELIITLDCPPPENFCYPENLEVLVEGVIPPNQPTGKVRWLRRIPKDPFTGEA